MHVHINRILPRISRRFSAALIAATVAVSATALTAAEPRNPLAAPDSSVAPAAAAGSLTIEQIGDALEPYGKNTTTINGHTEYSIDVKRGKWNLNLIISMSPNGSVIWMTNRLTTMPADDKISKDALLNVLKKNTDIGPMFFSIAYGGLRLSYPVPNANLTAAGLRAKIDAMASTIVETESLWNPDTLAGSAPPAEAPKPRNPLAR